MYYCCECKKLLKVNMVCFVLHMGRMVQIRLASNCYPEVDLQWCVTTAFINLAV